MQVGSKALVGRAALAPVVVAMLVMVVWGATPVLTRIATDGIPPVLVAVGRTVIAGVVALPLLLVSRQSIASSGRPRTLLIASSLTGFVIFPLLYTVRAAAHLGHARRHHPRRAARVHRAYVALVGRRRPAGMWAAGCVVALAGEAIVIGIRVGSAGADPTLVGDLLVLASGLAVSAGYVAGAQLALTGYPSRAATFWGVALAALVIWPVGAVALATGGLPHADVEDWLAVVFLAVITSILGYIGWYWALSRGGIVRIGTLQFLQPLSGLALAALVLGERLTLPMAVGAATVIAGVTIAQRT